MKKKCGPDLKSIWEKAAKKRNLDSSSPTPQLVTTESQAQNQNCRPSVELQLQPANVNVIQAELASTGAGVTEVGSNDPESEAAAASTHVDITSNDLEVAGPSSLSPIRESNDDEAVYDLDLLSHDPGKRIPIKCYDVNERNSVIRGYIALGPCQPRGHDFPVTKIGGKPRRFVVTWFDEYKWLEYSVELDAVFCFVCYLFKHTTNGSCGDAFVNDGFRNWHMKKRVDKHVGGMTSFHNVAQDKYNSFLAPKAAIDETLSSISDQQKAMYMSRLSYSLQCLKLLLRQGLACRGHDESESSLNKGNFLELLNWLAENFEEVRKVVLKNAPLSCKLTAPKIQKDIINCCAKETTKLIMKDLDGAHFAILADESSDVYQKEQLAVCLRYVDKKGKVVERFLGVFHVENTSAVTLKAAIVSLLIEHSLSLSMVRGQGYDGASNMKGHVNGLKTLIMDECPSAYYVHCFAHQLQLTLVAVAKENQDCI